MKRIIISLIALVVLLTLFGLLMIYDASSYVAFRDFEDKYHYLRQQSIWAVLGFTALGIVSLFDYKKLYYLALPLLLGSLGLLFLVFVPGIGVEILGAKRWINIGFSLLQPSEFVKISFAIYLAAWFSTKEKGRFLAFLLILGLIIMLVMLQPDMGTAVIILTEAIAIYFLSGGNILHLVGLSPLVFIGGFVLIKLEPYRAARLTSFLNMGPGLEGTSYHIRQTLIALGSGGLTGVGIGNSLQKYAYLPESTTDSIFAIVGEELGFIGALFVISLFIFFLFIGFKISLKAKDTFGKLLAAGITTFIITQTAVNLGAQTVLLPLTGVPLPFISYGGSSLMVHMISVGILISIARKSNI